MAYETVSSIISDVAVEVGLSDPGANPFTSTDDNITQLLRLLTVAGRDLLRNFQWSQFRRETTVSLLVGVDTYALPSDFARMLDQTAWNRTTQLPLGGPLSSQQWQTLKAQVAGGVVDVYFRVSGLNLEVTPVPQSTATVALEYITEAWVQVDGDTTPTLDRPAAATDVVWFDPHLVTRKLRLLFLEAKGFDVTAARADFERAWDAATSADSAAPVLSLHRGFAGVGRLLDESNIPETGFGVP